MIDKREIIKEHLNDCEPDQLHDGSYVTIKECVEMMDILEQKLVKNLGLQNFRLSQAKDCLMELCQLKVYKDDVGKDTYYQKRQPELWQQANELINEIASSEA